MSITDELREYVRHYSVAGSSKDKTLTAIADRIDEAHKHAIAYVDDRDPETMAEHGWVKLPVDADGEPLRVGDEIEYPNGARDTVRFATISPIGWAVNDRGWKPEAMRHHHPPTVEDVLFESLRHFGAVDERTPDVDEWLHEHAKRLRLAGEGE